MPLKKTHKRELKPKRKDQIEDRFHHGKPSKNKVKYNHKSHWLDEEENDIVPYRVKKTGKKT